MEMSVEILQDFLVLKASTRFTLEGALILFIPFEKHDANVV